MIDVFKPNLLFIQKRDNRAVSSFFISNTKQLKMAEQKEIIRCAYFVQRKKRFCRMTVKIGNKFCGEHNGYENDSNTDLTENNINKRVKCPLNPSHTCYESKLAKHLKVCNTKRLSDSEPAYIVKGINILTHISELPNHIPLSKLDPSIVKAVINKINSAYDKLPEISQSILQHVVLNDTLNNAGIAAKRHLIQNSSLLAHLERSGLVKDNTCFIEFGAGRGKLAYWLAQIVKNTQESSIVLVDRSSHRHKYDNKLKNEGCPLTTKRIRSDIADLDLKNVPEVKIVKHKVGIAKHLCGAATDLTIQCMVQTIESRSVNNNGLVIAFCCHHRCDYASYTGKTYLEQCGFGIDEFYILCSIASWATCGSNLSKVRNDNVDISQQNTNNENLVNLVNQSEREAIGRKVKMLLNWGRLEYLKSYNFQTKLYYYVSTDVSPENMCIVAVGNNNLISI